MKKLQDNAPAIKNAATVEIQINSIHVNTFQFGSTFDTTEVIAMNQKEIKTVTNPFFIAADFSIFPDQTLKPRTGIYIKENNTEIIETIPKLISKQYIFLLYTQKPDRLNKFAETFTTAYINPNTLLLNL